jgi:hypothetical protein
MTPPFAPPRASAWWLYAFLLLQFACQAALVVEPLGGLRLGFRVATFASSLAMLVLIPVGGRPYPLRWVAGAVVVITALGLLHPQLNTPLAGLAQIVLTLAIWCPVFWVGRVAFSPAVLRNVLLLLWGFHTLSATVGVLQVYDPGRFAPDPAFVRQIQGEMAEGLKITLDDGSEVWRPFGLTDSPGGAASSGAFAALLGIALVVSRGSPLVRLGGLAAAAVGMFCIYICQVRSVLVITAIGMVGMVALLAVRGRLAKAAGLVWVAAVVVGGGFIWATTVGSEVVIKRLETLVQDRPEDIYYSNRGAMVEHAVSDQLLDHPVGAGLGRWGMMFTYFGDPGNPDSPPLWAEVQPAAWVLDGGLPLLILAYVAVIGACVVAVRLALRARHEDTADAAAVIAAFDVGILANTFSFAVFISQTGMMFWVLNAALFAAWSATRGVRGPDRRPH